VVKIKLKPVEGSADEDIKEIEEANQIRLRAISAIQTLLICKPHLSVVHYIGSLENTNTLA